MNKSAITISTDYNYITYLKRALDTLYKNGTNADIYVYAVNFTDVQIDELNDYNIQILITIYEFYILCKLFEK